LNDEKIREVKALILNFGKDAIQNLPRLEALCKEFEGFSSWELSEGALNIVVTYLAPIPESDEIKMHRILKGLTNKTVVLVEGKSERSSHS
jgi:hypothetical protein